MKTVYIETSVVSYLTARPSRDVVAAAHQHVTHLWWNTRRPLFQSFISEIVEGEASAGDPGAAERRLAALEGIDILDLDDKALALARKLMDECGLPEAAKIDATHIAIAAVHGMDYLVTWNCRHIDNAEIKPVVRSVCALNGYACPEICTPEELMGDWHYEG